MYINFFFTKQLFLLLLCYSPLSNTLLFNLLHLSATLESSQAAARRRIFAEKYSLSASWKRGIVPYTVFTSKLSFLVWKVRPMQKCPKSQLFLISNSTKTCLIVSKCMRKLHSVFIVSIASFTSLMQVIEWCLFSPFSSIFNEVWLVFLTSDFHNSAVVEFVEGVTVYMK